MARYTTSVAAGYAAHAAGVPAGTTPNGYLGYWGASAAAGFRLRRITAGILTTTAVVPTSQQFSLGVYRQSVAPAGGALAAAVKGEAMETWVPADPTTGLLTITANTAFTTGPTLNANPLFVVPLNTTATGDLPYDFVEEIVCNLGAANGLAFVNIGQTLPAGHQVRLTCEIEV